MRRYTIIWLLLGGGLWLFLQQMPQLANWQMVLFLAALVLIWIFAVIGYHIATFWDKDIAEKTAVIRTLEEIAFFGSKPNIIISSPASDFKEEETDGSYLTQNDALQLIDTAFTTYNSNVQNTFANLVDEKVNQRLSKMEEVSTSSEEAPAFEWSDEQAAQQSQQYQELLDKMVEQNQIINELEEQITQHKKNQFQKEQQWSKQLQTLQNQVAQYTNQQSVINGLQRQFNHFEKKYQIASASNKGTTGNIEVNNMMEMLRQMESDNQKAAEILDNKIVQLSKKIQPKTTSSSQETKAIIENIDSFAHQQKKVTDNLNSKISKLETHIQQLEKAQLSNKDQLLATQNTLDKQFNAKLSKLALKVQQSSQQEITDINPLNHKLNVLETQQKNMAQQLENKLTQTEQKLQQLQTTRTAKLDALVEKVNTAALNQNTVNEQLKNKLQQLENKTIQLTKKTPASAPSVPVKFDHIFERIDELEARQNIEIQNLERKLSAINLDATFGRIEKLYKRQHDEIRSLEDRIDGIGINVVKDQLSALSKQQQNELDKLKTDLKNIRRDIRQTQKDQQPNIQQILQNFDEVLAGQEESIDDLKAAALTKEEIQDLIDKWHNQQNFPNLEQVNELIEDALNANTHNRTRDYVTNEQFHEALMELSESVREQIRDARG